MGGRSPPDYSPPRQSIPGRGIVGGSVAARAMVVAPERSAGAAGLAARVSCAAEGGGPAHLPARRG